MGSTGVQGTTGLAVGGNVAIEPEGWTSGTTYQLLPTHNKTQSISPAIVNILRLPTSSSIFAGDLFHIINRSSNDVAIQSSSGDAVDTIRTGYIKCRALIGNPTLVSDWVVEEVYEVVPLAFTVNASGSCFANTQSITMKAVRQNKLLTYYLPRTVDTANLTISSTFTSSADFILSRLIPSGAVGSGADLTQWWNSNALNRISGGNMTYVGDTVVQISLSGKIKFTASTVWDISNSNGFPAYTLFAYKE
jgi:hypothetical protein